MAKTVSTQNLTPVTDDYLTLRIDRQAPVMERVLAKHFGIKLEQGALRPKLEPIYAEAAASGITRGRLTVKPPKGWTVTDAISVFDSKGLRSGNVRKTFIDGGADGKDIGAMIRSGALDGKGRPQVEFRILPCAEGYETRLHNGRRLEPVGLFYGKPQSKQKELFAEYQKAHESLRVDYATLMEIIVAATMDRECGIPSESDNIILNWGWYRTPMSVLGGVVRRLLIGFCAGRMLLLHDDWSGASPLYGLVASVGAK